MSDTIAAGQLRAFVERIERIEAEIKEMNADKSEVYKEARGVGFDVKAIRKCVAKRKLDDDDRQEQDAIFDLYWEALTGASRVHVHEDKPETAQQSEGPKSRPGDAAASLTQQSNSPRQERPSAEERSSDRSGGQFGDAPKPATIPHSLPTSSPVTNNAGEVAPPLASPAPISDDVPAFLLKERKPLRPLCLNPSECAGYGSHTCHRCLKAAGQGEVAA